MKYVFLVVVLGWKLARISAVQTQRVFLESFLACKIEPDFFVRCMQSWATEVKLAAICGQQKVRCRVICICVMPELCDA